MWKLSARKGGASWRSVPAASLWPPVGDKGVRSHLQPSNFTSSISESFGISRCTVESVQLAKSYLHPLGQQLGIFRGLLLVLLSALSLQSNATALVLQHTRSYQSLDPGGFSSGFLACRKTITPHFKLKNNFRLMSSLVV